MLGKRYIALTPVLQHDGDGEPIRGDDGKLVYDGHRVAYPERLHAEEAKARDAANAYRPGEGFGRVIEVELDQCRDVNETDIDREGRLDRQLLHAAAELAIIRDRQEARGIDKSDQDYHARAKRTHELRERAAIEIRQLLERFKPPHYVIETRQNVGHGGNPCGTCGVTWFGRKLDGLMASSSSWLAYLKDPRPDGSDAHIAAIARTETGALAKLLQVIMDGGGFFPMT